jgi:hypothetical protein
VDLIGLIEDSDKWRPLVNVKAWEVSNGYTTGGQ